MLTDDEISGLSASQREELILRLSEPVQDLVPTERWLQRTRLLRLGALITSAFVLVPWIGYLSVSLPRRYVAHNWDRTWVGFDVLLLAMLLATAVLGMLRRQLVILTGFATGLLLVCDAWFDVMTADSDDVVLSVVTAVLVELPLGLILMVGSLRVLRLVAGRLSPTAARQHAWQIRVPIPGRQEAVRRSRRRR